MGAPSFDPRAGWRHAILHTRGAWLPGDPRGFRSVNHKIHSSGDYKHRPPADEHRGLYEYSKKLRPNAVRIPAECRSVIGEAMIRELKKQHSELMVIGVCPQHVHMLVTLPYSDAEQWDILGDCKRVGSHAVRGTIRGGMWGRKGRIERVRDAGHFDWVYGNYIPDHRKEGAWVWDFERGVVFDPAQ